MPIRVLHVLNNLGSGGAESFIMNMYRKIDRERVQFDFLIRSNQNGHYVEEIQNLGGKVYILPSFPRHIFRNYRMLKKFIKTHSEYSVIHVHANALIYIKPLKYAKKAGIPNRILHSHNTKSRLRLSSAIHMYRRERIDKYVTKRLACGFEAGRWMHGMQDFEIINNGIDLIRFAFDEDKRESIRKQYQIENKFVVGHVGRFTLQKNHKLLLQIFHRFSAEHENACLMLVGNGEELDNIKAYAERLSISDKVVFVGAVENVEDYLSAMDVFVFPSLYEGFPVALLEAQANGLPCVVSDTVSPNAILNRNCKMCSLDDPVEFWVRELGFAQRSSHISDKLQDYDSRISAKQLEMIYLNER